MTNIQTLAIDVGGTGLKAAIIDSTGNLVGSRVRIDTPYPLTPAIFLDTVAKLIEPLPKFDRISAGFPGIIRDGLIITAPHFGNDEWYRFPVADALGTRLGKPARVLNDAEVQGLGAIKGIGLEFVITLGTGLGSALFRDGEPMPHMEFSQWMVTKKKRFNDYVGNAALREVGVERWSRRVGRTIALLHTLFYYDHLYIGGGNAHKLPPEIVGDAQTVSNETGLTGGIHLWDREINGRPKRLTAAANPVAPKPAAAKKPAAVKTAAIKQATAKPAAAAKPAARKAAPKKT